MLPDRFQCAPCAQGHGLDAQAAAAIRLHEARTGVRPAELGVLADGDIPDTLHGVTVVVLGPSPAPFHTVTVYAARAQ